MPANWKSLDVQLPGSDLLAPTDVVFDTLTTLLGVVEGILSTVQAFIVDLGNPVKPLVDALLAEVKAVVASLSAAGIYVYLDVPDLIRDPEMKLQAGGFSGFLSRFKSSLYDISDANRPQPAPGSPSGFLMLVADAETSTEFLSTVGGLIKMFNLPAKSSRYPAPTNLRVVPLGNNGDPILGAVNAFKVHPKALAVEWSAPQYEQAVDPGFTGLASAAAKPLTVPFYLVERTTVEGAETIPTSVPTNLYDRDHQRVMRTSNVKEESGEPFLRFTRYDVVSTTANVGTFLLGQLGTFRYIDSSVQPNIQYHYRVRALPADIPVQNNLLTFPPQYSDFQTNEVVQGWPIPVGLPSPIVSGSLPEIPVDVDWLDALRKLFRACFALGFHLNVDADATFDPTTGVPNNGTAVAQMGRGLLTQYAGIVGQTTPEIVALPVHVNAVTGRFPNLMHFNGTVQLQATRLAVQFATRLLQNSSKLVQLRGILKGPLSTPLVGATGYFPLATSVETLLDVFVKAAGDFPVEYDAAVYQGYSYAYSSVEVRKNYMAVLNAILPLAATAGAPPDWSSVNLLKDVAPWSMKVLKSLEDQVQALSDAYKGTTGELGDFIGSLNERIDAVSALLTYIDGVLSFIASFSGGFYVLSVPSAGDTVDQWVEAVTTAQGDAPQSGANGYTGGVVFGWVGPGSASVASAMSLLFT